MSPHEPSGPTAGIPLEASVDELRRRCEAVARLQGGSTYHHEELGIFRDFAEEKGFFLAEPPPELNRTPDEEGNEHQIWFTEIDFESQFRCNSSDGYLAWIDRLLQVRETANSTLFCSHVARLFVGETKLSLVA